MGLARVVEFLRTHRVTGSRAGWTVADQVVSSLTNAGLAILVARSVEASAFGAFSIAFVTFTFVTGVVRAWVTDPLVIRYSSGETVESLPEAARQAAGTCLVVGVAAGAACAVVALSVTGDLRLALLALAVSLPGLLVQDAWRFAFFAAGRPVRAATNDLVLAAVTFSLVAALLGSGRHSVSWLMLAWGAGGVVAAVTGACQHGGPPRPLAARRWLRTHHQLGSRLGLGVLANLGAVNVAVFFVGGIAGLAAAGSLRAAQTLLGPLQVLFSALTSFALPSMARTAATGSQRLLRPAAWMSGMAGAIACAWVAALLLLPDALGRELLGDSWAGAGETLPGLGLVTVAVALSIGGGLALKAMGEAGVLLRLTLVQAGLILVLGCGGAVLAGARGAATGFAAAQAVGLVLLWSGVLRVHARSSNATFGATQG